jgi:hypothetical protein
MLARPSSRRANMSVNFSGHVLNDHDARNIRRQRGEDDLEGLRAAGGGADGHHPGEVTRRGHVRPARQAVEGDLGTRWRRLLPGAQTGAGSRPDDGRNQAVAFILQKTV